MKPASDTLTARNPATGADLGTWRDATPAEVDAACRAAAAAAPALRALTPAARAGFLDALASAIEGLGDELLATAHAETALPMPRLQGERARTTGQLRLFAGVVREGSWVEARIDRALPQRQPLPRPDVRRLLIALGPVAVFSASNFPFAFSVAGGDAASAFAAGCPVVVKGHPGHPGTSALIAGAALRVAREHGLPDGTFALLQGAGHGVGLALVRHDAITAVAFTGSLRAGRALHDAAAARTVPIPVYAEMGATNPVFVLAQAATARAGAIATALAGSATLGVGQFCTKPGLIIGHGDGFAALTDALAIALRAAPAGTMLYAGLRANYVAGLARLRAVPGVRVLVAGDDDAGAGGCRAAPALIACDAATLHAHPELSEECFGPVTVAVRCSGRDELIALARALPGQLTATVHGDDAELDAHRDLLDLLANRAGRVCIGGVPTGVEPCPAMHHGGPYPATTDARSTAVGTAAIARFARPVCWQNCPDRLLPAELQDANPRGIWRLVDGETSRTAIG